MKTIENFKKSGTFLVPIIKTIILLKKVLKILKQAAPVSVRITESCLFSSTAVNVLKEECHTRGDTADMENTRLSRVFWQFRVTILDYFYLDIDLFIAVSRFHS